MKRCKVSGECRTQTSAVQNAPKDTITSWSSLQTYCAKLSDVMMNENNEKIESIKRDGFPPRVSYTIFISHDIEVEPFKQQSKAPLRDVIPSFSGCLETTQQHQWNFLSRQLLLQCSSPNSRRYPAETVNHSLNIFLKSRNAYRALQNTVSLPSGKTLNSYFGKLGTTESNEECKHVIGFAIDEPTKPARPVLAIMIAPWKPPHL